jgi:hypothetical protein
MATKKNSDNETTTSSADKTVDDHSVDQSEEGAGDDVTVTVGSDTTTTEVGDVTVEHWDHPKTHKGTPRINRGDRVIKYASPSHVDESE